METVLLVRDSDWAPLDREVCRVTYRRVIPCSREA